jgi:hypothetical protein
MMGAAQTGAPRFKTIISVQATYSLDVTPTGVLTCNDVIKVPLSYGIRRQTIIGKGSYNIIPVVELAIPLEFLVFEIITNEGVTVEPFSTLKLPDEANPYNNPRSYFVLPSGTTGIKDVIFKPKNPRIRAAFQFGVLPPPYNYDNALFGVTTLVVSALDDMVDRLETKTNNLRIVSNELNASFPYKDLPKGSGKQTLNIDKDMLFIGTNFTYLSVPSTVHSPKITVSDGITTKVYTLSLDKSVRVIIDLLTATLTAYDVGTGEIVQQRKIFETVVGYKSIDYEDFDDILGDELTVLIGGRSVE